MKTKLLFLFCFISVLGFSQAPIASYYGPDASYIVVTSSGTINHTAGANQTWNFNTLSPVGSSEDMNAVPTAGEISTYPGTAAVVTTNSTVDNIDAQLKIYSKNPAGILSITGVENIGLTLNFDTNNATVGAFPMNYGFTNSDTTAGNYINGEYAGTFTGTIVSSADAWGTLNMNDVGAGAYSGPVTRLKTVQNISLNYGIFTGVGTVVITTYSYYDANNGAHLPELRTTSTAVNVPLLSIDQTVSQMERFATVLLGTDQSEMMANSVAVFPNPATNVLNIQSNHQMVQSVSITDTNGRLILKTNAVESAIDVSALQKGIYFASVTTDKGVSTQKFVKQ
ncbi:MAG TPA: T9SS type A sorting domain-containing protein [Flavobacterium sp.]|nr:T9SS type A sorting domain-containing protein [Flavobacterium sp.]